MKSLFTLLLAVGSLTTVFAQNKNDRYGKNDNNEKRDYAYNDRRYSETFSMSYKEKEFASATRGEAKLDDIKKILIQ